MKLLELHILQSSPVSCVNRDDMNSPKTAIFGGVQRARVSSQCWKRAIRQAAADTSPALFKGRRSRTLIEQLAQRLTTKAEPQAQALALSLAHYIAKLDPKNEGKVKTTTFFTAAEYDRMAEVLVALPAEAKETLADAVGKVDISSLASEDEAEHPIAEGEPPRKKAVARGSGDKLTPKKLGEIVS